ncbi:MAG: hypothetical protein V5B36_10045 [Candidatus Accumulibacter sp. UW25]|jgi:hypothetical protein
MGKQKAYFSTFMLAALMPLGAHAEIPEVAELPAPKVGEVWKYRTLDMWNNTELRQVEEELVEIQVDRLVFRGKGPGAAVPKTLYYGRSLASCRRMRDSEEEMCTGAMAFPLRVGNRSSYAKRPWRNGEGHSSAECEVKGVEGVTVPAGTFESFRVECDGNWHRIFESGPTQSNSGRFQETLWYSPTVGRYVKSYYVGYAPRGGIYTKEQTELIEFVAK